MVGSIKTYTPKYSFIIPEFDVATWHDYIEANFRAIDALLYNVYGINNFKGEWTKLTEYKAGDVVFVGEDKDITGKSSEYEGRLVKVIKDHVTDNSDGFHYFYELNTDCYELYFDANNAAYFAQKSKESADASEVSYQNSKNLENIYINFRDLTEEYKNLAQDAATNASNSEQSALTAASTAINTVQAATDLLNTTQQYTESAIETITNTRDEAVETVTTIANEAKTTAENAITSVENTKTEAENEIAETVEQGRVTIQTYVDNAEEEVREIARVEAQEAIADAKQDVQDYADTTIKPSLQIYVDNTENNAQIATEKANIATIKANESLESANASANSAISANNSAEQAEEALKSITGVYRVKGSVATYNNLPSVGQKVGDVYNVLDSGANYVWTDNGWDKLSETVDLSNYALKTELPTIAGANVPGLVAGGNLLTVNQNTGKMECGELTKAQYDSANGYTFIGKTTLENVLTGKGYALDSNTVHKTGDEEIAGNKSIMNELDFRNASKEYRGFMYKQANGNLALGIRNQNNSAWQNFLQFQTNGYNNIKGITTISNPTEDTTTSNQIDTVGARNSKLANYAAKTELNSKADTTLSNINAGASAKEMIVGWGMPDYTAGIETTASTYTAPSKGWLYMQLAGRSEDNSEGFVYINGQEVGYVVSKYGRSVGDSTFFCPMDVGDVMTMNRNIKTEKKKIFYPMKGV